MKVDFHLQVLHDEMKPEKSGDGRSTREVLFQELNTAYDVALEVTHELREEHKFYNELILLLLDFQLDILEFCITREGERESKLQKFLPVPTIPSSENSSRVNTGTVFNEFALVFQILNLIVNA